MIYIHPTDPAGVEAMLDYWLMPLVGFLMDTTLAASKLVFSGVVERHPRIRWVLTHMGGATASRRTARPRLPGVRRLPPEHRPPAVEYLRTFYYDSVNFNASAMRLALDFAGEDRSSAATIRTRLARFR